MSFSSSPSWRMKEHFLFPAVSRRTTMLCTPISCHEMPQDRRSSAVELKLTHLEWDSESVLIHFQGQYLNTCEADYGALAAEIQRLPKSEAAVDVGELCLVEDGNPAQWFRGRVQSKEQSSYDVLLIDRGNVVSAPRVSSCPKQLLTLPPKLLSGFLADVLLSQSCCPSALEELFSDLIGRILPGFVRTVLPHHVVLLEVPDINRDLVRRGFGRHVDSDTFLCLAKMLTGGEAPPREQRVRPLLQRYGDFLSFCGPRLPSGTEADVHVTAALDLDLFYCRMLSAEAELSTMSSKIGAACGDPAASQRSLDELCAVKGRDGRWYRGFLLSPPIHSHLKVFFMDCGYCETVRADAVCELPALGFHSPPLAFPCRLAAVTDRDEKAFRAGLLGGVLTVNVSGFQKEQFLYTVTITGVKHDPWTDPEPPEGQSSEPSPPPAPKGEESDGTLMCGLLNQTLAEEKIRDGSAFEGYVQYAKDPENFWVLSAARHDAFQEMTARMTEHFQKLKLYEDVLVNPRRGAMCCALYEADMHFYRAVVLNNLSCGAEVLFIDYGNTQKVPHIAIKKLPETFSSRPAFAFCCSLENVFPPEDVWTTESCDFFREAVMDRSLQVHVVQRRKHRVIVNLYREGSPSSLAELLTRAKLADYVSMVPNSKRFGPRTVTTRTSKQKTPRQDGGRRQSKNAVGFTALSLTPGSRLPVRCSHVSAPSEFWCQPRDRAAALDELMLEIQQYYSKHAVPLQPGARCCVVRSPLDGRWYRGAVLEEESDALRVMLVDCGPTLQVTKDRLQGLKPEFAGLETQAFRCCLDQPLSRGGPDGADPLRSFVLDCPKHLQCQLVSLSKVKGEGPCHVVQLYNTLTQQRAGSGPAEPRSEPEPAAGPESFVYSAFGLSAGRREQVYVSHVSSQSELYCQLSRNGPALQELDRVTAELCQSGQPGGWDGVQKKLCLAKYLDGVWYRCLVLRAAAPPYVSVFFVDYGNTYICERSNVAVIPEACRPLLDTPMQALKCNLAAVPHRPLSADAKGWLMDAALDRSMTAAVLARRRDGSFDVDMFDGHVHVNQKVRELLAKLSLNQAAVTNANKENRHSRRNAKNPERRKTPPAAKPPRNPLLETRAPKKAKEKAEHTERTKGSNAKKQRGKPLPSPQQTRGEEERLPAVPLGINPTVGPGLRARAFTSFFSSCSSFFLQLSQDQAAASKMVEDLNADAVRSSLTAVSSVRNGDMVLAEYEEDGALYRSMVQSQEGGGVGVDFLDYGNSAVVGRERIFALPLEFRRQHRLSVPCSLLDADAFRRDAALADAMLKMPLMVEFVCQSGFQWQVRVDVLDLEAECQNKPRPPGSPAGQSSVREDAGETGTVLADQSAGSCSFGLQDVPSEPDKDPIRSQMGRLDGGGQNNQVPTHLRPAQQQGSGLPQISVSRTNQVERTCPLFSEEEGLPEPPQPLPVAPVETDRAYSGVAAAVTTPWDFSVVLDGALLSMAEVSLLLEELAEAAPPLSEAVPGSCALFLSEQTWCRTRIIRVDSALILDLVDYGYHRRAPLQQLSQLKKLPEQLSQLPRMTQSCSLRGVGEGAWSEEAAVFFRKLVCQKSLQIFFRERLSSSQWGVDVLADGVDAATELVNAGLAGHQHNQSSAAAEDDGQEETRSDDPPHPPVKSRPTPSGPRLHAQGGPAPP